MSKTFQVGGGDKVKVFIALLPLGDRTPPVDVAVIAASGITLAATSITVTALTGAIAGGTQLIFDNTTDKLAVYLTKDAKLGDTTLHIEPAPLALTGSSTAEYVAKLRLLGGTQLSVKINADKAESLVFEDPYGYKDGAVTGQSWELPWTANLLSGDDAFRRVFYAGSQAISGREVYVWQQDPPPAGYAVGDGLEGAALIINVDKSLQSSAICTVNFSIMGQGSPKINRFSLV